MLAVLLLANCRDRDIPADRSGKAKEKREAERQREKEKKRKRETEKHFVKHFTTALFSTGG